MTKPLKIIFLVLLIICSISSILFIADKINSCEKYLQDEKNLQIAAQAQSDQSNFKDCIDSSLPHQEAYFSFTTNRIEVTPAMPITSSSILEYAIKCFKDFSDNGNTWNTIYLGY